MNAIILTIALSLTVLITNAQTEITAGQGQDITVTVPTSATQGTIKVGLYNEATFMKAGPLEGLTGEIKDGKAAVTFKNVAAGEYAISIYHDKNDNNQMDFAPNGMPKEDYGSSNNDMSFGPPNWTASKFNVEDKALSMEIRM
jgi:uncharacterized protein (DUF2141 family)